MTFTWHPQIFPLVVESDYQMVVQFYEEKIEDEPDVLSHYWYLGLSYLLQDNYAEAQGTWFLVLSQAEPEEIDLWTQDLVFVLETEAIRQEKLENWQNCWLIRKNLQELEPDNLNNLLFLIGLEIQLEQFSVEQLEELGIIPLLEQLPSQNVHSELLLQILTKILSFPSFEALSFAQASLNHLHPDTFITTLSQIASIRAYDYGQGNYASDLIKLCLPLKPEDLELLNKLFWFNIIDENYTDALDLADQFFEKVTTPDFF